MRVFFDPVCLEHRVPSGFPERPERLEGILEHLSGVGRHLEEGASPVSEELVAKVHERRYLRRFSQAVERRSRLLDTDDNPLSEGTWKASWAASSVAVRAADWVAGSAGRRGMALVRPPGHHAESDHAMGFCYLNNVALVAEHLLARPDVDRVAIFDFDVHHGNGTQHSFEARPDVLFISTHQYPFYPGTGAASEVGVGAGRGATLNLPLTAGTGDDEYTDVCEASVFPAVEHFRPQLLLVSAGFDAWREDPLGGLRLSDDLFGFLGRRLAELADEHCEGRLVAVLEGGYDLEALPHLVDRFLDGLDSGAAPAADGEP